MHINFSASQKNIVRKTYIGVIPRVTADDEENAEGKKQRHSRFENVYSEAPTQELSDQPGASPKGRPRSKAGSDSRPTNLPEDETTIDRSVMPSAYADAPKASEASGSSGKNSQSSRPSLPSQTFYEQEENDKDASRAKGNQV